MLTTRRQSNKEKPREGFKEENLENTQGGEGLFCPDRGIGYKEQIRPPFRLNPSP